MASEFTNVTCPACFQTFDVAAPSHAELPIEMDYDCEICCRPMTIFFQENDGDIVAEARGLEE